MANSICILCGTGFVKVKGNAGKDKKFCSATCWGLFQREQTMLRHGPDMRWCSYHQRAEPKEQFTPKYRNERRGISYCREGMRKDQNQRTQNKKQALVVMFGESCSVCGYSRCIAALDFHHPDPSIKEIGWGTLRHKAIKEIAAILTKEQCVLMCSNCHREFHWTGGK
jgi:hypothetical protein